MPTEMTEQQKLREKRISFSITGIVDSLVSFGRIGMLTFLGIVMINPAWMAAVFPSPGLLLVFGIGLGFVATVHAFNAWYRYSLAHPNNKPMEKEAVLKTLVAIVMGIALIALPLAYSWAAIPYMIWAGLALQVGYKFYEAYSGLKKVLALKKEGASPADIKQAQQNFAFKLGEALAFTLLIVGVGFLVFGPLAGTPISLFIPGILCAIGGGASLVFALKNLWSSVKTLLKAYRGDAGQVPEDVVPALAVAPVVDPALEPLLGHGVGAHDFSLAQQRAGGLPEASYAGAEALMIHGDSGVSSQSASGPISGYNGTYPPSMASYPDQGPAARFATYPANGSAFPSQGAGTGLIYPSSESASQSQGAAAGFAGYGPHGAADWKADGSRGGSRNENGLSTPVRHPGPHALMPAPQVAPQSPAAVAKEKIDLLRTLDNFAINWANQDIFRGVYPGGREAAVSNALEGPKVTPFAQALRDLRDEFYRSNSDQGNKMSFDAALNHVREFQEISLRDPRFMTDINITETIRLIVQWTTSNSVWSGDSPLPPAVSPPPMQTLR